MLKNPNEWQYLKEIGYHILDYREAYVYFLGSGGFIGLVVLLHFAI